jgi:hypothetical protein
MSTQIRSLTLYKRETKKVCCRKGQGMKKLSATIKQEDLSALKENWDLGYSNSGIREKVRKLIIV